MKQYSKMRPFAKKSLGQNFLIDGLTIQKIVDSLQSSNGDQVIEIGPGRGALTREILDRGALVTALELDRELAPLLREEFKAFSRFQCVECDVLETDLAGLAMDPPVKLVGNLPYYISTAVIQKLIDERHLFSRIVLMLQREVADRIAAKPGNSSRGYLTVLVEDAFEIERVCDVAPSAFLPRPKVWSSVVSLIPRPSNISDTLMFRTVASAAFAQKRKTILNNLRAKFTHAESILEASNIQPLRRAETLTRDEWAALTDNLAKKNEPQA